MASVRRSRNADEIVQNVLAGDRLQLARAITLVENEDALAHELLAKIFLHTGRGHIIGVTGAPGSGKSTLVTALALSFRAAGNRVAIVAIDPTSPFTGGAVLGDRVRMRALSGDSGVFIRSMATRGSLGGLAKTTGDTVTLLDAAGHDCIIVETVGVGQAEVEIARTAHTTLVVEAPDMGDEVQAIKAGILEIADILVVNKADRPGVDRTVQALEMTLEIEYGGPRQMHHHRQLIEVEPAPPQENENAWRVRVLKAIAKESVGIEELRAEIEAHRSWLDESDEIATRERLRIANTLENIMRAELNRRISAGMPAASLNEVVDAVRARQTDPYSAARDLLRTL